MFADHFMHRCAATAILLFLLCASAFGLDFTAVMTETVKGETHTGMIYVKDGRYRMEEIEDEQNLVVIVDERIRLTRVLLPDKKQYIEMEVSDPRSLINDPFQAVKHAAILGDYRLVGTERIDGYDCEHYKILLDDKEVMDEWVSITLDFPIKIATAGPDGRTVELTSFLSRPLEDSLFEIPAGYVKVGDPQGEQTTYTWNADVARSIVRNPPFQRLMFSEEVLRIPVRSDRIIKIVAKNQTDAPATFVAVPLLDREPIWDPARHVRAIEKAGERVELLFEETEREAQDIAVHAVQGTFVVEATYAPVGLRKHVSAGEAMRVAIDPDQDISLRLVNLSEERSQCWVTFYQKEKELDANTIGPIGFRTFELEIENQSIYRTWSSSLKADEVLIHVDQGELLVGVRQP